MLTSLDADFNSEIGVDMIIGEKSVEGMSTSVHVRTSIVLKSADKMPTSIFFSNLSTFLKLADGLLTSGF